MSVNNLFGLTYFIRMSKSYATKAAAVWSEADDDVGKACPDAGATSSRWMVPE